MMTDSQTYFETGRVHYLRNEYEQAVRCFEHGAAEGSSVCLVCLGQCYELGLGVEKSLPYAKDLYRSAYNNMSPSGREGKFGVWLEERLNVLKDIPLLESETRHIHGLGNVRVVKSKYNYVQTKVRYNKDEIVVEIDNMDPLLSGFSYAQTHLKKQFSEWTCDGRGKFYDGYTLETDFFTLKILKGGVRDYEMSINGRELTILVPEKVSFEYPYVQVYILNNAKGLLKKRAEIIIPQKLKEVADRIGTSFKKCRVVLSSRSWLAINMKSGSEILFCAEAIQLPEKSLEALCIHELTHNYVDGHGPDFHKKMIELGGEQARKLDLNLFGECRWPYLNF